MMFKLPPRPVAASRTRRPAVHRCSVAKPSLPPWFGGEEGTDIFEPLPIPSYVLEALDVCPGAPTLLVGCGFTGKSLVGQSLLLALVSGSPSLIWGMFAGSHGLRAVHLDYEQGRNLTLRRYQRLARAMGVADTRDRLRVVSAPSLPLRFDAPNAEDELTAIAHRYDVVLIDSLRAACPGLDENSSDFRRPLDLLQRVSERTGATMIAIHHRGKPRETGGQDLRFAPRGSSAIFDAANSVLVLDRPSSTSIHTATVTHTKARTSGSPSPTFELSFRDVEIDGDPRAGLAVEARAAATNGKGGAPLELASAQITGFLSTQTSAASKEQIGKHVSYRRDVLDQAIQHLSSEGRLRWLRHADKIRKAGKGCKVGRDDLGPL